MTDIVGTGGQPVILLITVLSGALAGVIVSLLSGFVRAARSKLIWWAYELILPSVLTVIFAGVNYVIADGEINPFTLAVYIASVIISVTLSDGLWQKIKKKIGKVVKRDG